MWQVAAVLDIPAPHQVVTTVDRDQKGTPKTHVALPSNLIPTSLTKTLGTLFGLEVEAQYPW